MDKINAQKTRTNPFKKLLPFLKKLFRGSSSGITRRWILNNMTIVFVVLLTIFVMIALFITDYYYTSIEETLRTGATSMAGQLSRYVSSYNEYYNASRDLLSEGFSEQDKLEMQITDEYSRIIFSSAGLTAGFSPGTSDVAQCIESMQIRTYSGTDNLTGERVMSCSVPVIDNGGVLYGAVRYVTSLSLFYRQIFRIGLGLLVGFAVIISFIIMTNSYFIKGIVNPIVEINRFAQTIAGGHYGAQLDVEFNDEVGELCKTLNNMSLELVRMEKVKNDFISSVSHELRTPLTAINGWAETVLHDLDDPAIAESGLNVIRKETSRLSQVVEELLDFSRIESGEMRLQSEAFDVRGQLYDSVYIYNEMLKTQNMQVRYEEPDEPVQILGDKNRLKQVFLNIIDNGAKYGNSGEFFDIRIETEDDKCYITFRDYGQGIPEKELPFVKDRFFKGSAKGRGTGIGLAVCNEIVTLHKGELIIESEYGEGTLVKIILPILSEELGQHRTK